jgi:Predicted membrane protein
MPEQTSASTVAPNSTNVIGPIAARERIDAIDVLRGFTIFGILLVNMPLYGWPNWGPMRAIRAQLPGGPIDDAASWFLWLLAEDKFYPLLSFLFGVGFSIQLARLSAPTTEFLSAYRRRLLALLLIGSMHGFLVWSGDILVTYSLTGFLLLPFRALNKKTILAFAIALLLVPIALMPVQRPLHESLFAHLVGSNPDHKALWNESLRVYSHGTFAEISLERARAVAWSLSWPISWLQILGFFLIGLYAGRREFFQKPQTYLPFIRKALWWALALSVVGMLFRAGMFKLPEGLGPYLSGLGEEGLETIGNLAISIFYAAALILLAQRRAWKSRLAPLTAVGRMALSNYLFQSVVCTTLFYSYGLALFGKVGPAAGLALSFAIYAVQVPLSVWWLRRFRFGPMEWVWRSLTYGKAQTMRLLP